MTAIRLRSTLAGLLLLALPAGATDWPQLQADSRRSGHTRDSVPPPYRARWIWCGPDLTLRNRDSEPGWSHDLRAREGYSYPMPRTVGFTRSVPIGKGDCHWLEMLVQAIEAHGTVQWTDVRTHGSPAP